MSRSSAFGFQPARALGLLGLAGLALITLADRGATRMYVFPWSVARSAALLCPPCLVLLRALSRRDPLRPPPVPWLAALGAAALGITASALASPWSAQALPCAATPLSALAGALLVHDWLAGNAGRGRRFAHLWGAAAGLVAAVSLCLWAVDAHHIPGGAGFLARLAEARNGHPLGHSNYTAGLAVILIPWPAALALGSWDRAPIRIRPARARGAWALVAVALLAVLVTSGSRGGLAGLAAATLVALRLGGIPWRRVAAWGAVIGLAVALLAVANPRIRSLLRPRDPRTAPDQSQVQRSAMAEAGWMMGLDRPVLGWGPGSTPYAYPHYRPRLAGGVEDAFELHSTPVQLWAEYGGVGVALAAALLVLALRGARDHPVAGAALAGYAVFALTDWQMDVPALAFAVAALGGALMVSPDSGPRASDSGSSAAALGRGAVRWGVAAAIALPALLIGLLGRRDPIPDLNARALAISREPGRGAEAAALLEQSLRLNGEQELAEFNLGWILVVRDPEAAARHFATAARLVPDKGGVYFGLGLAALNRGDDAHAVGALALECLDDPVFLTSPWWHEPRLAQVRPAVLRRVSDLCRRLAAQGPADRWPCSECLYVGALADWFRGKATAARVAAAAASPQRQAFFLASGPAPAVGTGPVRAYRRERTGYPVLMREPDLAPPVDLYEVYDDPLWADDRAFLFPAKGWLPSPTLVALLGERAGG